MERIRFKQILVLLACMGSGSALGSGFGLGIDVVRLIDENQDQGMVNLFLQVPVADTGALVIGHAKGDNLTVLDVSYKHYLGARLNSAFFQAGVGYYDADFDEDLGFVGQVGYERRLAKHFVVTGSVKMVAGVDEAIIGYPETPVYQPSLGVMLAF